MNWRARLISNLGSWIVQEGPLEQVGCECCTELDCTAQNYQVCERRLKALATAQSERQSESAPESTVRVKPTLAPFPWESDQLLEPDTVPVNAADTSAG